MKVFILLLSIATFTIAERLLSTDELQKLFRKFVSNNLTEGEKQSLEDVFEIFYAPEHYTSAEIVEYTTRQDTTRSTILCLVCRSAFAALFEGVQNEQTDEQLENALSVLCVSLGIQTENVCRGAVRLNINILTYIVRNTPEATPESFCSLALQTAFDRDICPSNDARFEWVIELPPQPTITPRKSGLKSTPLKAAVLTDAHIDPLYEAFGVADCDEPVCCRRGQLPARSHVKKSAKVDESIITESLVVFNDKLMIDLDIAEKIKKQRQASGTRTIVRNAEPAGYWGDYRNCDTPLWAYDDVIDNIAENHQDVDIVYYIGDSIDHGVWETSYELINEMNLYIIEKLRKSFGDDVLVVPVIGNHEAQPTNQFAPSYVTGEKLNTTWLYDALANKWDFYLTEEAKASLRERGDFSMLIAPGLRVITVNNNVSYRWNWWLVFDPLDAKRHLDWLVEELYRAELAGESVHILMHIPPGVHDLQHTWTREYNRIINRFSSTIKAEFNGHIHSDEFKIFYSLTDNTPINVAWGAGGATAFRNYNLNYKIVTFDPATYEPLEIANYVYNLTEANLTPNRRPHWFQLYDLKQRFGLSDLSAGALDDLVTRMVTDNRHLLDMYVAFSSKMSDNRWPYCDNNCKIDNLCRSVVTVLWDREKCEELRKLYFL